MTMESGQIKTLFYADAFIYVWQTSKKNVIARFIDAVIGFFCGREVSKVEHNSFMGHLSPRPMNPDPVTIVGSQQLPSRQIAPISEVPAAMPQNINTGLEGRINDHSTQQPPQNRVIPFKNFGNTCFINTGLKLLFEAFGPELINEIDSEYKTTVQRLQDIINNQVEMITFGHELGMPPKKLLDTLISLEEQLTAFMMLAEQYFTGSNQDEINKSLKRFINSLGKHVAQNPESSAFREFFKITKNKKEFNVKQGSSSEFIIQFLQTFSPRSQRFVLKNVHHIKYESEPKPGCSSELSLVPAQKNQRNLHTEKRTTHNNVINTIQAYPDASMTASFERYLAPHSVEVSYQSIQTEINRGEDSLKNSEVTISSDLKYYSTTQTTLSANLDKLSFIIVEPTGLTLSENSKPIYIVSSQDPPHQGNAKTALDENISISLMHENEATSVNYQHGKIYTVELQPICAGMHCGGEADKGHKVAVNRDKNGLFYLHDDGKIGRPESKISKYYGVPEVVIYKVISKTPENTASPVVTKSSLVT